MIYNLYSIKDELSEFAAPFTITDDNQAKRFWRSEIVYKRQIMMDNPEDYSLYKVGKFETETGIVTYTAPEKIESAKSFVRKKEEKENGN